MTNQPVETVETTERIESIEGELISVSQWTDYVDLGLKALLVIAAFLIAFRL